MIGFKHYYTEAITKDQLFANTDDGRKFRGKTQVKTRRSPLALTGGRPELQRSDYIVKAKPTVEDKTHHGYIDWNPKTKQIHEMFCDCKDFFYRLYAPLEKDELATWDLDKKYNKRLIATPNRDWTDITNPDGKTYVCKHLFHILDKYIPN
jgi:hypothetical protein